MPWVGPIIVGVFVRLQVGPASAGVQQLPEPELVKEMAHDENRPPGAGLEGLNRTIALRRRRGLPAQEALQHGQQCHQGVTAPEIENDFLLGAPIFAHGLDDADVFVDHTGGAGDFDGADEHGLLALPFHPAKSTKM